MPHIGICESHFQSELLPAASSNKTIGKLYKFCTSCSFAVILLLRLAKRLQSSNSFQPKRREFLGRSD
eukprot:6210895-Pleurochrysis_carterae.AAC.4